jgi:hypothetical protein
MGLLRLVQAARLAPLEEVMAELSSGSAPRTSQRGTSGAAAQAGQQPVPDTSRGEARAAAASQGGQSSAVIKPPAAAKPEASVNVSPPSAPLGPLPGPGARSTEVFDGIDAAQVAAIKTAIASQQRFLAELVDHASRWQLDKGEVSLYFPTERRALAEMLQARESMEKLRTITSGVLGQPLRVCVKLEAAPVLLSTVRAEQTARELRARFEQDPIVRKMLERFGGRISEVKGRGED